MPSAIPTVAHELQALAGLALADPRVAARPSLLEQLSMSLRGHPLEWGTLALACAMLAVLYWTGVIRPGGLDVRKRDVSGHPAWMWLACAVIGFSGVVIAGSLAHQVPAVRQAPQSARSLALVALASGLGGVVAGWIVAHLASGAGAAGAGLTPRWSDLPRGVLAFALAAPIVHGATLLTGLAYLWINHAEPPRAAHPLLKELQGAPGDAWVWAKLGGAVVLAPIMEEFIYRAFVQSGLLRLTRRGWVAVLLTATVFAGMHVVGPTGGRVDWTSLPTLLVLGIAMGAAYERTGRIGVPMTMHMLFNAANVAMMWIVTRS